MADRVVVYVDAQNVLHQARRCFHAESGHHTDGQIDPFALGELICSRAPPGYTRTLSEVRMYTGRPDSSREPRTYGAHRRQCQAWERAGGVVIPQAVRYPMDWPASRAEQKGVDVQLAIDFIAGALDDRYEVDIPEGDLAAEGGGGGRARRAPGPGAAPAPCRSPRAARPGVRERPVARSCVAPMAARRAGSGRGAGPAVAPSAETR